MDYYQNLWKALQEQKTRYQSLHEGDLVKIHVRDMLNLINVIENLQFQIDIIDEKKSPDSSS